MEVSANSSRLDVRIWCEWRGMGAFGGGEYDAWDVGSL